MDLISCELCRLQILRLAHWAATTALIVYLISRLSEFSARRASVVCLAQTGVITFGFIAFLLPTHFACERLGTLFAKSSISPQLGHSTAAMSRLAF